MSSKKQVQFREDTLAKTESAEQAGHGNTIEDNSKPVEISSEQGSTNLTDKPKKTRRVTMNVTRDTEESAVRRHTTGDTSPPLRPASDVRRSLRKLFDQKPKDRHQGVNDNKPGVSWMISPNAKDSLDISQPASRVSPSKKDVNQKASSLSPCKRVSDVLQPKKGSFAKKEYIRRNHIEANASKLPAQRGTQVGHTSIRMVPPMGVPQVPIEVPLEQTAPQRDILSNMLNAWYWTGYYSGLERRMAEE